MLKVPDLKVFVYTLWNFFPSALIEAFPHRRQGLPKGDVYPHLALSRSQDVAKQDSCGKHHKATFTLSIAAARDTFHSGSYDVACFTLAALCAQESVAIGITTEPPPICPEKILVIHSTPTKERRPENWCYDT